MRHIDQRGYETVAQCGHDGAGCANMQVCGKSSSASTSECGMQEAKVCTYVRDQNRDDDDASLVPGYDVISTFSTAMSVDYNTTSDVTRCFGESAA